MRGRNVAAPPIIGLTLAVAGGLWLGIQTYQDRLLTPVLVLPEILLGLNQTIMLALSILMITSLAGRRDLGQEVYIALTKTDTGRELVAGFAIAFIAIMADRVIHTSAGSL